MGGQALDLLGEGRRLPEAGLTRIHELKTGALLTACLVLGGMAAGGPGETTEALRRYGRGIGLAFQIMDDILDATSTAAQLGKEPSDEELEKSTYVGLLGVHEARARGRGLVGDAVAALDEVGLRAPRLRALANYVIERER